MNDTSLKDGLEKINEGIRILQCGPLSYYIERAQEYQEALFNKFAPFKIGDRVRLIKTPEINENRFPGWLSSKHFLIEGAVGTVESVDYRDETFCADVVFDNESWIDSNGTRHPIEENGKHTFLFSEKLLVKINHPKGVMV